MGLTADIDAAVGAAFDSDLADAVKTVTLQQVTSTYNEATGAVTDTTVSTSSRGVVEPVNHSMVDGEAVTLSDMLFTILQSDLGVEPDVGDNLVVNGTVYNINVVLSDPADVTWTLVGRSA